jgi:hypothetical protein
VSLPGPGVGEGPGGSVEGEGSLLDTRLTWPLTWSTCLCASGSISTGALGAGGGGEGRGGGGAALGRGGGVVEGGYMGQQTNRGAHTSARGVGEGGRGWGCQGSAKGRGGWGEVWQRGSIFGGGGGGGEGEGQRPSVSGKVRCPSDHLLAFAFDLQHVPASMA